MLDVPAGVRLARPIIIRWHAGEADRALISRTFISLGEGATATVLEELVASGPAPARWRPVVPRRDARGPPRSRRAARARQPPGAARDDRRVPAPQRDRRRGRHAPLGARPARVAARPQPRRQPARGRPQLGRAGRDRLRRLRPGLRPDVLHPPRRAGHDRQPAVEGRAARSGPLVHEGDDRHRSVGGRHRQLPRRVRDEPVEGDPLGRDPVARDRPARLPPRRPCQLGRPDRREPAVLPREPRDPARRGAQVHRPRASSSRSSRGCRWPTPRSACATCSRQKWDAGTDTGAIAAA